MRLPYALPAVLAASVLVLPAQASAKAPARPHDFDGDGRTDLVVNAYRSIKRGELGPGAVAVLYGKTNRKQVITRDSRGVASVADHGDYFGESTASADFDRDGYADLAITGRNEDGVTLVYGSKKGLSARAAFLKTADVDSPRRDSALAVGDFDRDGYPDLVTTVRNQYQVFFKVGGGTARPGPVGSFPGRDGDQPPQLVPAVGDFTGDGRPDLVLRGNDEGFLLKNSRSGLSAPAALPGFTSVHTLAVGDFNGDRRDDLATVGWDSVKIHLGRPSGLAKPRSVTGVVAGVSIAVADVDRDGKDDLAIGAPYAGPRSSGQVTLLHGHKSGLTTKGARLFSQKDKALKASPENGDTFGWAVRLLDVTGDRRPELVIGSPGENKNTGRLYVLPNKKGRIATSGTRQYKPQDFGLGGSYFGFLLLP